MPAAASLVCAASASRRPRNVETAISSGIAPRCGASNGSAVKLPAPKCTSEYVWSMIWCEDSPATHIYGPAARRSASSAG
jgi:hypothetical protein